jgi:uncharacterized membrane protein
MYATTTHNGQAPGAAAKLASGLGWFSLSLGAPQVVAPDRVNELIGVRDDGRARAWQRVVGGRELAAAAGILGQRRPTLWLWGRVAGDLMDLGLLGGAFVRRRCDARRLAVATASVVGVFVADLYAAARMSARPEIAREEGPMKAKAAITIRRPREEVERRWKDLVRESDVCLLAPLEVTADEPGRRVTFRSGAKADHRVTGVALFTDAPGDRGTEIHLEFVYASPAGRLGEAVQKLSGEDPLQFAKDDLRRFRQLLEVGEIVRSEGSPEGHSVKEHLHQRPAQPLEHARPLEHAHA